MAYLDTLKAQLIQAFDPLDFTVEDDGSLSCALGPWLGYQAESDSINIDGTLDLAQLRLLALWVHQHKKINTLMAQAEPPPPPTALQLAAGSRYGSLALQVLAKLQTLTEALIAADAQEEPPHWGAVGLLHSMSDDLDKMLEQIEIL